MANEGMSTSPTISVMAGSIAGISTDIVLFPLDTIKTRIQSEAGLWRSGGLKNIFRGVGSAALGSAPSGASFFFAYELSKQNSSKWIDSPVICHMISACIGETFSCLFRIPFEVVKQQAQASVKEGVSSRSALLNVVRVKGVVGLYQGYFSMIHREIPFTLIQFPLWEYLKTCVSRDQGATPLQSAICGSVAGGIAAAVTTPLDVAKTRIILTQDAAKLEENPYRVMLAIARKESLSRLFSGILPRVAWISIGGFIFLGTYDKTKVILRDHGYT